MSSWKHYCFCAHSLPFGCRPDGALTPPPGISELPSVGTGSDSVPKDSGNPPSKMDSCTCGAEGKAHKKGCPLSSTNRQSGRTLYRAPSNMGAQANPW